MESPSQLVPCLLYLLASVFGAVGQLFYKWGGQALSQGRGLTWSLIAGVVCFCFVMVLFVAGFKMGAKLSVVYPFYAMTFVWGALLAMRFENEPVSAFQWGGILLITVGVGLIAFKS